MKRLVLTFAILIGLAAPVWAGYYEGVAAYERGDYATALREFRPLAEQGNADAQSFLGFMYQEGQGVPQDYAAAVRWYRKAAKQGDADAQNNLGFMYRDGRGVPQDYAQAARWFRSGAELGDAFAQFNLGATYGQGKGVPQNYVQAHKWFNLAAANLCPGEDRDRAIKNRDFFERKMTPAQVAEAQRLAREWKPK